MTRNDFSETTAARLQRYFPFSPHVIVTIASYAAQQAQFKTYKEFFRSQGVSVDTTLYSTTRHGSVSVVDVAPNGSEKGTIVVHLPMGNPLDPNQLYQVATIAGTNPGYRVIGFGNPTGKPYYFKDQNLTFLQRWRIASLKSLRPLVEAELAYLDSQKVRGAVHVGFSYGAVKALIESTHSEKGTVKGLVMIELLSHPRSLKRLLNNFKATLGPMNDYVNKTGLETYKEARRHAIEGKQINRGLARPISIAIAFMLSRINTGALLKSFMTKNPTVPVTVAWGSNSELVNDARMVAMTTELQKAGAPLQAIRLPGLHHALANDVHLHAAIIRQALLEVEV
jgi:pimeloyl-ACP methyl ester carboxylesterase